MSNRFVIEVQGIEDEALATEVESTIRAFLSERSLPGSWKITAKPSPIGGRLDIQVFGLDLRHTLSISIPPAHLATFFPSRLRDALDRCIQRRTRQTVARLRDFAEAV
jgi:hypothetical protein